MKPAGAPGQTYRMRFELRLSMPFTVETREIEFRLAGRPARLRAVPERALKDATSVAVLVGGFATEEEARDFGHRLQRVATLAGIRCGLGVDAGSNRASSAVSEAVKRAVLEKTGTVLRDRVRGVDVYPEGRDTTIFVAEGKGSATMDPAPFLRELDAAFAAFPDRVSGRLLRSLRLRAEADLARDELARMLLAIASVEGLVGDEVWTPAQELLLDELIGRACTSEIGTDPERADVVDGIARLKRHPIGVREGLRRLLRRIGRQELWPALRDLYDVRSALFHGGSVTPDAQRDAIGKAMELSKQIVLTEAAREMAGVAKR